MKSTLKKTSLIDWLIALGLFGVALWLRTSSLAHFVTADEHNWIYRSGLFLNALLRQDWPGTSVWYTPAVTTTPDRRADRQVATETPNAQRACVNL